MPAATMNALEHTVYSRWKLDAKQCYYGACDVCHRNRDDDGHLMLVARQPRRRQRECFGCYVARTEP